jgi:hypothetical protein
MMIFWCRSFSRTFVVRQVGLPELAVSVQHCIAQQLGLPESTLSVHEYNQSSFERW